MSETLLGAPGSRFQAALASRVAFLVAGLLALAPAPTPAHAQETHLAVITGLGGDPELRERFREWSVRIVDAARSRFGLAEERITWLSERPEDDPERIDGPSRREDVEALFARLADTLEPDDRLLVILIGHGSWDGDEARINLPGPDVSAAELGAMLDALAAGTVAVVNTASASGPFVGALADEGRIVITATASGRERNLPEFGGYFAEALAGDGADMDRDGAISLLEAYTFALREVERSYEEQNLLLTEHARLDDTGRGEGVAEPEEVDGVGDRAAAFVLGGAEAAVAEAAGADPELRRLLEERRRLEERVRELRAEREGMEPEAYDRALEELLLELARVNREIRSREEGGS